MDSCSVSYIKLQQRDRHLQKEYLAAGGEIKKGETIFKFFEFRSCTKVDAKLTCAMQIFDRCILISGDVNFCERARDLVGD